MNLKVVLLSFISALQFSGITPDTRRPMSNPPPDLMLWVWEQHEDLSFIDPNNTGVAYLAATVNLSGDHVVVRSRTHTLRVPRGTILNAVVRVEMDFQDIPARSSQQRSSIVATILAATRVPGVSGVQIDFDARKSERPFYRTLLNEVRAALPDSMFLSITALASWCLDDHWIGSLPVNDAIPMLFRMGPDRANIMEQLTDGRDFSSSVCRQSIGIATDEPPPELSFRRRIYIFNPQPWTKETYRRYVEGNYR